jgi:hypothetical protein
VSAGKQKTSDEAVSTAGPVTEDGLALRLTVEMGQLANEVEKLKAEVVQLRAELAARPVATAPPTQPEPTELPNAAQAEPPSDPEPTHVPWLIDAEWQGEPQPSAAEALPAYEAISALAWPVAVEQDGTVRCLVAEPLDIPALHELAEKAGKRLILTPAPVLAVVRGLRRTYAPRPQKSTLESIKDRLIKRAA